jgi:hypothetical protein
MTTTTQITSITTTPAATTTTTQDTRYDHYDPSRKHDSYPSRHYHERRNNHAGHDYYPSRDEERFDDWDDKRSLLASTCPWDRVSFDINGPWISGNVGDTLTVRRTLTAVSSGKGGRPVHFRAVAEAAPGSDFSTDVPPPSVSLTEGESEDVIIMKASSTTPLDTHQVGQVSNASLLVPHLV